MVISTVLAICIPLTAIITAYSTLKAVQLGLRWQVEVKSQEKPSMEKIKTPVEKIIDRSTVTKRETLDKSIVEEWLGGEEHEF